MRSELQRLVDTLGDRLGRSVSMDDAQMRLQAYSPHRGPVDEARIGSILRREVPDEWIEWAHSLGVSRASGSVRLPPNPALGFSFPRVGVPIRYERTLLGYLWLIDPHDDLRADELAIAEDCAAEAAAILYREQLRHSHVLVEERELARDLLASEEGVRNKAARRAAELDLLHSNVPVAAIVIRAEPVNRALPGVTVHASLAVAMDRSLRVISTRCALRVVRSNEAVILLARGWQGCGVRLDELAPALFQQAVSALGSSARVAVGIGEEQPQLATARTSYVQACDAVHVALAVPGIAPVLAWRDLGIYRLLCRLPLNEITADDLPSGLVRLYSTAGGEDLVTTLECYLENAGGAKETAAQLFLHRTSLYHRLARIEKIAGVRLDNGADRLELHVGLKLAKIAGIGLGAEMRAEGGRPFRAAN